MKIVKGNFYTKYDMRFNTISEIIEDASYISLFDEVIKVG